MTPLQASEIRLMENAGKLAARTLNHVAKFVKPGITTNELDKIVEDYTRSHDALPAPLGYHGYPKSICASVNDCVCHGVPDDKPLKEGDIVNVDVTTIKDGFHGDTSAMFTVGEVSEDAKKIIDCAFNAMHKGIEEVRPFGTTGDIGFAINKYVTRKGAYVVKEIGGHGIGRTFHDDPFVPSYGKKGRGPKLKPWCCLTVEPMVNEISGTIREFDIPNSTVKYYNTAEGGLSAQFEHTVLVTDTGYQILTIDE